MSDMAPAPRIGRERRHGGEGASWMVGVILILVGLAFLFERAGWIPANSNWWAIFIYLAAFAGYANVWRVWRAERRFTPSATASLSWGLVLTVVGSIFLFSLSWDLWWPAILIAVGIGFVVGYMAGDRGRTRDAGPGEPGGTS